MTPTETRYTKKERKSNGVFYTPSFLSNYLSAKVLSYFIKSKKQKISILDPACGDSILLSSLIVELTNVQTNNILCYGLDQDINAINNSCKFFQKAYPNIKSSFIKTNSLFPLGHNDSLRGWEELKENAGQKKGFDIIISNPPWGADLSAYNNIDVNFKLAKGQYDIYDLFVEMSLQNLKQGGMYAFILPDSIFSQEQWRLRQLLVTSTTIHMIARLGEKIFPEINRSCALIIGINKLPPKNHLINCFHLNHTYRKQVLANEISLNRAEEELSHKIPQERFVKNDSYIFDIDSMLSEKDTLQKFEENTLQLKDFIRSTRGAEISKKGIVCQCPKCTNWFPYPKIKQFKCTHCGNILDIDTVKKEQIISKQSGANLKKIKVGEDLYRYTSSSKNYIDISKKGINYKKIDIYNGTKILVRKTGIGITASIDYEDSITTQVVFILNLLPQYSDVLTLEFVLAILNSRAITYYLIKKFGENEWRTHPYITQTALASLPFPNLNYKTVENQEKIKKVTDIIKTEVANSKEKNISKANDIYIEQIVAELYSLNKNDYESILQTLSSAEQLIPIKRLVNCTVNQIFEYNGI